jgi:predicted dehydrogenase
VGVVGVGYFGTFHCGKIADLPGVELAGVADIDPARARDVANRYGIEPFSSHRELAKRVDAAVVAVPTSAHHDVAADLLSDGLDLLVEKPLAVTVAEADHLCHLAAARTLKLQVGHLERFNPVFVEAIHRIHKPRYVRLERSGPFPGRGGDVDVVLELMTHDLDILLQLSSAPVASIQADGWPVITPYLDVASARIRFRDGLVADLLASRCGSSRRRNFTVLDAKGTLEVDLAGRRICRVLYDGGAHKTDELVLAPGDPLLEQDRAFIDVLHNGEQPRVGATAGRDAVDLASRILACIRHPLGSLRGAGGGLPASSASGSRS